MYSAANPGPEPFAQHYIELLRLYDACSYKFDVGRLHKHAQQFMGNEGFINSAWQIAELESLFAQAYAASGDVTGVQRILDMAEGQHGLADGNGMLSPQGGRNVASAVKVRLAHGDVEGALQFLRDIGGRSGPRSGAQRSGLSEPQPYYELMLGASERGDVDTVLATIELLHDAGW
jgi:hypothetical protein